jgi:hypothetical protein
LAVSLGVGLLFGCRFGCVGGFLGAVADFLVPRIRFGLLVQDALERFVQLGVISREGNNGLGHLVFHFPWLLQITQGQTFIKPCLGHRRGSFSFLKSMVAHSSGVSGSTAAQAS